MVTLFSRQAGKVKAVAKGVGKPKSKMSGTVELFNLIECLLYKKENADLGTMGDAAVLDDYHHIPADTRKFGFGSAWCEILQKTSHPDQPRPETFELTALFFKTLDLSEPGNAGLLFWSALFKMLAIEGYAPRLEKCLSCGKKKKDAKLMISLGRGGLICAGCIEEDEDAIPVSQSAFDILGAMGAGGFEDIAEMEVSPRIGREAAEVILSFASYHLGLPRNLKSFKFLESLGG